MPQPDRRLGLLIPMRFEKNHAELRSIVETYPRKRGNSSSRIYWAGYFEFGQQLLGGGV